MAQATVHTNESIDDIYCDYEICNLEALTEDVKAEEDEDLMNAFMAGIGVSFTGFDEFRQWWESFSWGVPFEKSGTTILKFKILTGEESDEEGKGWFWIDMFVEDVSTFLYRLEELEGELDNYPVDFIAEYLKDNRDIFMEDLDVVALEGETREQEFENFGRHIVDSGYMPELEEALDSSSYLEVDYYSLGRDFLNDYSETKSYAYRLA